MKGHLRRIWTRVQLDPDMSPVVEWRDSRRRLDPAIAAAAAASPNGLVVLDENGELTAEDEPERLSALSAIGAIA